MIKIRFNTVEYGTIYTDSYISAVIKNSRHNTVIFEKDGKRYKTRNYMRDTGIISESGAVYELDVMVAPHPDGISQLIGVVMFDVQKGQYGLISGNAIVPVDFSKSFYVGDLAKGLDEYAHLLKEYPFDFSRLDPIEGENINNRINVPVDPNEFVDSGYLPRITIYTDGSCLNNPGYGGMSYIIFEDGKRVRTASKGYEYTTNNRMELTALCAALRHVKKGSIVDVYTDSTYLMNPFVKKWIHRWAMNGWCKSDGTDVVNRDLWEYLYSLKDDYRLIFHHVIAHNGDRYNEECDYNAKMAAHKIKMSSVQSVAR